LHENERNFYSWIKGEGKKTGGEWKRGKEGEQREGGEKERGGLRMSEVR